MSSTYLFQKGGGDLYEEMAVSSMSSMTRLAMEHRIKEHRRAYSSADSINSAVAEHSLNHEHAIDWNNSEVVAMQQGVHKRCIIESWTIRNSTSTMNRDKGLLPDVYNSLIALGQASS